MAKVNTRKVHLNAPKQHFSDYLIGFNQGKTEGQQLKGKIVSEFLTLFRNFFTLFRIFPQEFPLQNKGFELNEKKREEKIIKRTGQIDVAP